MIRIVLTAVVDDKSEYYKANSVCLIRTLDFAGRKVTEDVEYPKDIKEQILKQVMHATSQY